MKKYYFILCICFLSCFIGCGTPVSNIDESDSQSNTQESEYGTQSVDIPKTTILDNRIKFDEKGILWKIPNDYVEQGLQQTIMAFEENLLIYGTGVDEDDKMVFKMAILSTKTGKVLQSANLTDIDIPSVQVWEKNIVVSDWSDGEVVFLNDQLQISKTYHTNTQNGAIYVNPNESVVYCFTQKDGIQIRDLNTQETNVLLENTANLLVSGSCGEFVSIGYTDLETQLDVCGILNLVTGIVETIPFSGAFYDVEYQEDIWKAGIVGEQNTYLLGKAQRPNIFVPNDENGMVNMLSNPSRLCVTAYQEDGVCNMKLYDIGGNFLSEAVLPIGMFSPFYDVVWSETYGGYFFTATDFDGKDVLLFWDLSTPINGELLHIESQYHNTQESESIGEKVSQEQYEKAKDISSKYGLEVKIAEQTDMEFIDFTVQQELEEHYISSALNVLETVCSSYPNGFMEQLLYGTQREIEVHLVGTLTKRPTEETDSGFTSFDAFVEEQEGKTVLVVDITKVGVFEQTLYHEIAHLIDHKLAFDDSLREDAIYSEEAWQALNPDEFVYADSYHDIPIELYADGYEAYFIDIYSRTFAKEDRARIMEYAMMESVWTFSDSSGRLAKLEYWSRCIRDAFDTTGWPEETVWEKTLEKCLTEK